jgi:hypothetical protein
METPSCNSRRILLKPVASELTTLPIKRKDKASEATTFRGLYHFDD